jgi:protein TonB
MQVQVMQEKIKAKALQIAADVKQHWKVLVLASPLLLAPVFIAIVETLPPPPPTPVSVTVTLPPVAPYQQKGWESVVPSQQVVQVATKVVYVEVPAKEGKPATTKAVEVPVQAAPAPAPVQQVPAPTVLDRIFTAPPPPPKPTPRAAAITPVMMDRTAKKFQPDYPNELRGLGIQGAVHVRVTVGPNGRPVSIRPVGQADSRLVGLVQKHGMKNWRFKPATVDGMPSTGNIDISLTFTLADE